MAESLTQRAIADLVVVLQKNDKSRGWQVCASLAAGVLFVLGVFALIDKSFRQAATEFGVGLIGKIRIIAVRFRGQNGVQAVMDVVVPLRIELVVSSGRAQETGLVGAVLQDQVNVATATGIRARAFSD